MASHVHTTPTYITTPHTKAAPGGDEAMQGEVSEKEPEAPDAGLERHPPDQPGG